MEERKDKEPETVVEVTDWGPLIIKGNFILKDLKREVESVPGEVHLCRCGRSANKPFCDESHKR